MEVTALPTYVTIWNAEAFWMTTVVPVIIMLTINYGILYYKLRLSPLKFIRRDLSSRENRRAVYLSTKLGIFRRFRLRVIFQNISNYMVLFVGILFANLLLFFGCCCHPYWIIIRKKFRKICWRNISI